jgi:hypothetical protein
VLRSHGLFERTQHSFEPREARALGGHQRCSGKHEQALTPIGQRDAIVGGNQPKYAFQMGNFLIKVLEAHQAFLKKRNGQRSGTGGIPIP